MIEVVVVFVVVVIVVFESVALIGIVPSVFNKAAVALITGTPVFVVVDDVVISKSKKLFGCDLRYWYSARVPMPARLQYFMEAMNHQQIFEHETRKHKAYKTLGIRQDFGHSRIESNGLKVSSIVGKELYRKDNRVLCQNRCVKEVQKYCHHHLN